MGQYIGNIQGAAIGAVPEGKLIWSDEFDGELLDESKWGFDLGAGGWGNHELQCYTNRREKVYVKDSLLHIRAVREDYNGSRYTSARLLTRGKFDLRYGTVVARIALPTGMGVWPAFWMLGSNLGVSPYLGVSLSMPKPEPVQWPACGEIDIIEAVNNENIVYGTNHWGDGWSHCHYGNSTANHHGSGISLDVTQFHEYRMVWTHDCIEMCVDGFMYHRIDISEGNAGMSVFHKDFFFLLNVVVGGDWPGFNVDDSRLPGEMLVDYIRVYSLDDDLVSAARRWCLRAALDGLNWVRETLERLAPSKG